MLIPYPNPMKIKACGDKVAGRSCAGSRSTENKAKPITIRFQTKGSQLTGDYFKDTGDEYGKNDQKKPYGWSKNMTNRMNYLAC